MSISRKRHQQDFVNEDVSPDSADEESEDVESNFIHRGDEGDEDEDVELKPLQEEEEDEKEEEKEEIASLLSDSEASAFSQQSDDDNEEEEEEEVKNNTDANPSKDNNNSDDSDSDFSRKKNNLPSADNDEEVSLFSEVEISEDDNDDDNEYHDKDETESPPPPSCMNSLKDTTHDILPNRRPPRKSKTDSLLALSGILKPPDKKKKLVPANSLQSQPEKPQSPPPPSPVQKRIRQTPARSFPLPPLLLPTNSERKEKRKLLARPDSIVPPPHCQTCQESFSSKDRIVQCTACRHSFHAQSCIKRNSSPFLCSQCEEVDDEFSAFPAKLLDQYEKHTPGMASAIEPYLASQASHLFVCRLCGLAQDSLANMMVHWTQFLCSFQRSSEEVMDKITFEKDIVPKMKTLWQDFVFGPDQEEEKTKTTTTTSFELAKERCDAKCVQQVQSYVDKFSQLLHDPHRDSHLEATLAFCKQIIAFGISNQNSTVSLDCMKLSVMEKDILNKDPLDGHWG